MANSRAAAPVIIRCKKHKSRASEIVRNEINEDVAFVFRDIFGDSLGCARLRFECGCTVNLNQRQENLVSDSAPYYRWHYMRSVGVAPNG